MIRYYKLDNDALVARVSPGEMFRVLNSGGKWLDGNNDIERYFYNGEIGMSDEITKAEALTMAEGFGETLTPIDDLEKELSDTAVV